MQLNTPKNSPTNMKNLSVFAILIPLLFVLTACPYTQKVPLEKPNQKINKFLLGKWVQEYGQKKPRLPVFFIISKLDDKNYQIECHEALKSDSQYLIHNYTAHITEVGKTWFLNVRKQNETSPYYFYKIELASDNQSFTLCEVTRDIKENFSSSEELKAFFEKQKVNSFFYNSTTEKYLKAKE